MSLKHMKSLIVLVVGLLAVGCETPMPEEKKALEQKQKALRDSVVGEYEHKWKGDTFKQVLLDTGIVEYYKNRKKQGEFKWSKVKGGIYIKHDSGFIQFMRFNKDKSITGIARIEDGKQFQLTFKKTK